VKNSSQVVSTNKPTPSFFYRLDALPVTQPTVSEHSTLPCKTILLLHLTLLVAWQEGYQACINLSIPMLAVVIRLNPGASDLHVV